FGIDVFLHTSWLFIAVFMVFWLLGDIGRVFSSLPLPPRVIFAVLLMLLFYASILLHEFGHSLVAKYVYKIEIDSIVLHLFGGVAALKSEARTPGAEFLIAIAGPLVSFTLAAGCVAGLMMNPNGASFLTGLANGNVESLPV